ncbi:MAG: hypothetical protein ACKOXU_10550 [Limnohabitans sp.]
MPIHQLQHWLEAGETPMQEIKTSFDQGHIEFRGAPKTGGYYAIGNP